MVGMKSYNQVIIALLLTFIIVVGVGGSILRPLDLATCTARGGLIAGGGGCGEV